MKKRILGICLAIMLGVLSVQSVAADLATNKETVFFPETKFSLSSPFLSEFLRLGGIPALGYPVSRPFEIGGFLSQAFQRGILQWRQNENQAILINIMDQLHEKGLDDYLFLKGIPRHFSESDGAQGNFEKAKEIRFAWLTQAEIREFYFGNPDPVTFYGLPTSRPEKHSPFITQRFQRGVLQLWVEDIPGMPKKGSVVGVLVGDLVKEGGFIPTQALEEENTPKEKKANLPTIIHYGNRNLPSIALTIDDAWSPQCVSEALQTAKKYGVKMTLFPAGSMISSQVNLWRQAISDGHEIGNHSFSHRYLTKLSDEEIKKDIRAADDVLYQTLGYRNPMRLFRPPWGGDERVLKIAQGEGFSIVMWSVDPLKSPSTYEYVVSRALAGDIVLLHFNQKDIGDLAKIIENFQKRGFVLTTISGLFGD